MVAVVNSSSSIFASSPSHLQPFITKLIFFIELIYMFRLKRKRRNFEYSFLVSTMPEKQQFCANSAAIQ